MWCGLAQAADVLVINHVNVIDVLAADSVSALKRDQAVVMTKGRITRVARAGEIRVPRAARVIDASGAFLIPGLYDMHVHTLLEGRAAYCFPLFIANGVTSVRDMGGAASAEEVRKLRVDLAAGTLIGPRIAAAPGRIVDGPGPRRDAFVTVANPEEARAWVRSAKADRWDFIKAYNVLSRETYAALSDEAARQHLDVAGHVPFAMTALEVSALHQRTIEHAADLLVSSSTDEAALRQRSEREGAAAANPNWARAKVEIDAAATYDAKKAASLGVQLAANGTWQCPTLVLKHMSAVADHATLLRDPRLQYIPAELQARWSNTFTKLVEPIGTAAERALRANVTSDIVAVMHRNGVKVLAGTDTPPQPYLFPGSSLHEELALLVTAGLSPLEALRAATLNPAMFLREQQQRGSIDRGKVADAVLLRANPLDDIANTRAIAAVVLNGRYLDRTALDALLAQAAAAAAKKH
ncbi:MAG TPA: amidohydrolase family protein [Thermoanaerobaculia bacterium]|nr:amidohydrolase family protein [Thermoanaerobaculia bacterium]